MSPLLLHGRVLTPQEEFTLASVLVDGERIAWVREGRVDVAGATRIAEVGDTIAPGFIDLQVNGFAGHDAAAGPEAIASMSESLSRFGVTGFVPTLISRPIAEGVAFVRDCASVQSPGARVLGAHVEGPFLNPKYCGAHDPACLTLPTPEHVQGFLASPPLLMTLAPELPGALEAIRALRGAGVTVSAGHSGASLSEAQAGFDAGIRFGTHLFNAMVFWHHRNPGLPGALLGDERITLGLIADGVHVHQSMLSLAFKIAGPGRIALTTDAVAAAASPPGRYNIAGRDVISDGTTVRLADGTLAGSAATMDHMVRVMAGLPGVSLRDAVEMASTTPARAIGIDDHAGSIRPGAPADLVVLDEARQVRLTVVGGRVIYQRGA
jgi:N-acetylglucosamine-6-phosphate deacetylase